MYFIDFCKRSNVIAGSFALSGATEGSEVEAEATKQSQNCKEIAPLTLFARHDNCHLT
jgi:hypothetical protein